MFYFYYADSGSAFSTAIAMRLGRNNNAAMANPTDAAPTPIALYLIMLFLEMRLAVASANLVSSRNESAIAPMQFKSFLARCAGL
jgi:hypothetical protein